MAMRLFLIYDICPIPALLAAAIAFSGALTGCGPAASPPADNRVNGAESYYIPDDKNNQRVFLDLFALLYTETTGSDDRFAVVRQIANEYVKIKEYDKLVNFLTQWVSNNPQDPYNAYYLLMTAHAYILQEANPVAAMYFELIVKNYPDLIMPSQGESIHLICLKKLIELTDDPEKQVEYYQELIARFPDKIDYGTTFFMLGQAYEKTGEWDEVIKSYTRFLPNFNAQIPGFADAFGYAKQFVDFTNSPKDWTFESLNALISTVKSAIDQGSSARLHQYRAKVGFFARSWEHEKTFDSTLADFNFSDFMTGNPIRYEANIDRASNANEAYLRTWGWSQYISVWYLYFRKIYFPPDPDIHGRWEWAGIYYGEKL